MSLNSSLSGSAATTSQAGSGPITFTGLGNGIDTASIIAKLISIDQQPITQLQTLQTGLSTQETIYNQLSSQLQAFAQSTSAVASASTFSAVTSNTSDSTVATVTSTANASAGTYNLSVTALAQAQKIASTAQASVSTPMNQTGVIVVNGKALSVSASDSLTSIASNINGLNAGVTASVIDGGAGNAYLTLASSSTGLANQMQFADYSGSVLQSLGIGTGTTAIRSPITNGAASFGFSSSTNTLQSVLGSAGDGAASITINGTPVAIDPTVDSLQSVANKINSGVSGVTASVQSITANSQTSYQLQISGASTPTFVDGGHLLEAMGILQQGVASTLVPGQDAAYSLDNVHLTSASNTVGTAIPGVTLTLLKGTVASPGISTISLSQNTASIVSGLQSFVSGFNNVIGFIAQNSQFDSKTFETGPLFGDSLAQQVQNGLNNMIFQNVPGVRGQYQNLAQIGFGTDKTGNLTLDTNVLNSALAANPSAVASLFESVGSTSSPSLTYITASPQTVPTTSGPYAVTISQVGTKQTYVAGTAQTLTNPTEETLTFGGALLQNNPYTLNLDVGTSLAQTVAKINSDATLGNVVHASINAGALEIDSKIYGAAGNFTVASNQAAASNNSGIGNTGGGTLTAGLDVAGTINGESATGRGQFLIGDTTNTNTAGLDLQYTGTATGVVGSVSFSQGMGGQLGALLNNFTQANTGLVALANKAADSQIANYQTQIDSLNAQLAIEQTTLQQEFAAMQSAMATLQAQSGAFAAINTANNTAAAAAALPTTPGTIP